MEIRLMLTIYGQRKVGTEGEYRKNGLREKSINQKNIVWERQGFGCPCLFISFKKPGPLAKILYWRDHLGFFTTI